MITFIARVLLIALGALFAAPHYVAAIELNRSPYAFRQQRRLLQELAVAFLFTVFAAIGIVGWRS